MTPSSEKAESIVKSNNIDRVIRILHNISLYKKQLESLKVDVEIQPLDSFTEKARQIVNDIGMVTSIIEELSDLEWNRDCILTSMLIKHLPSICHRSDCSSKRFRWGRNREPCKCDCHERDWTETQARLYKEQHKDVKIAFSRGPWIFCYPFVCMCCGVEITLEQFCFCANCGKCDVGRCGHPYSFMPEHRNAVTMNICDIWTGEHVSVTTSQMLDVNRHYQS